MGGSAFSNQGVLTPRMSPATYNRLKTKYHTVLTKFYRHVTTPPEAPGKTSYGDLDYLVAEPMSQNTTGKYGIIHKINMADVKLALRAEYMTAITGATTSFAVLIEPDQDAESGKIVATEEKVYAQIDVHVCPTAENMWWLSFKHSYGDLWSLLGMMGRAKGLVADEKCLNVRVEEIEGQNRELSKVELTKSVNETLEFFGLDAARFEKGFENVEDIYQFVVESRFFETKYFKEKKWANAHDRSKVGKREMMKGFFAFLGFDIALIGKVEGGEKGEDGPDDMKKEEDTSLEEDVLKEDDETSDEIAEEGITRAQVLEEALERFGKRDAYDEKVKAWRRAVRIDKVARGIAKGLIDGGYNSPKSARVKSSRVRKEINEGAMEHIFEMTEEELDKFIQERLAEIIGRIQGQPGTEADGGVAAKE